MTSEFVVTAEILNLRSSPELDPDNIIAKLPRAHVVTVLDTSHSTMWKVRTQLLDTQFEGFVSRKFLIPRQTPGPAGPGLKAVIDNGTELSFAQLKPMKSLVNEIQQRLSRLGFYPGGRMIDGQLGQLSSWTWKGLKEFCSVFQLPMVSEAKALDPLLAQALLEKRQATVVFARARDMKTIAKQIAAIQEATPVPDSVHSCAFLDREVRNSPFINEIPSYPERLARRADGQELQSYGRGFTPVGATEPIIFSPFPLPGVRPSVDVKALEFLSPDIGAACVCVGSYVDGLDPVQTRWLGRNAFISKQFGSSTKFIGVLNAVCQINASFPDCKVDNCRISGDGISNNFVDLVTQMVTYAGPFDSNKIAAMFKRFTTRAGLEEWLIGLTGNQALQFRGYYGRDEEGRPLILIKDPVIKDTLNNNRIVLAADDEVGSGQNLVGAYDLTRLMAMLGWHLHLPPESRLPGAQWHSLKNVVRSMGCDTARYVDVALETLGLLNVVSNPVIISKLGLVDSSMTYTAFVHLEDQRFSPAKLRTFAFTLWTGLPPSLPTPWASNGWDGRDNALAVATVEIIRRIFSEELA
jgi:hypothetical protein